MIDYEKLKMAQDLSRKYCKNSFNNFSMIHSYLGHRDVDCFELIIKENTYSFDNLEKLIEKLIELTQPEPKYKVGDELYVIADNTSIYNYKIKNITPAHKSDGNTYWYGDGSHMWHEINVYPTKQSLIEAQIKYWTNQQEDHTEEDLEKVECQHESDGIVYGDLTVKIHEQGQSSIPITQLKCIKCGESYK